MKVTIDGQLADITLPTESASELVNALMKHCAKDNRVVTAVNLDGTEIPLHNPEEAQGIDLNSAETVEVTSGTARDVAVNVLSSCADHIPHLIEGLGAAAGALQKGQEAEGMETIATALTFWLDISEGVASGMKVLGLDFDSVELPSSEGEETSQQRPSETVAKINSLLEETQRALEENDTVEIGDLLDYDLPPLLRTYQGALYRLAEKGAESAA